MSCHVAFMRYHEPYFIDAKIIMARVPEADNIYKAIDYLNMMEYFSCKMDLLEIYQEQQIPIRWE
jgi:hypothetical protein